MRLVCPNCGAQYEVDERVIPESGRDVQCSACGHAWYQMPQGHPDAEDEAAPVDHDETLAPEAEDEEPEESPGEPGDEPVAAEHGAPPADEEPEDGPEPEAAPRREVDDDVRSILREEAQNELSRRAAERVETQPDLGLDSSPSPEEERRRIARERMARMRGLDEDELPGAEAEDDDVESEAEPEQPRSRVPRRELFPDIEEINSTLDGRGIDGDTDAMFVEGARSGGFGRGFFLVIFLAALLLAVYMLAPNLAETMPMLEPALSGFVEIVNVARAWLDTTLQEIIVRIEAMTGNG